MIPSRNPWQRRTILMQADLACIHCTYNLRGLSLSDNCPECGRRIWDSLLTQGVSSLYRSTRMAAAYCVLGAVSPLLIAALVAMSHSASPAREPMIVTLFIGVGVLLSAGFGWFTLPIAQFQPSDRNKLWITTLMILSAAGVATAGILSLTLPAGDAVWIARAWTATILCSSGYLMRVMGVASRVLFVINHPVVSRFLQTAQILCLAAAAVALASLAMEFIDAPENVREMAMRTAAVAAAAVMLSMSVAAYAFSSYGPR